MADSTRPGGISNEDAERRAKKAAYDKARYADKREEKLAQVRLYLQQNAEAVRERQRKKYWSDPEKHRQRNRASSKKNRKKSSAREKEWRRNNKDKVRDYNLKYVNKKRNNDLLFRIKLNVRTRMCGAVSKCNSKKAGRTLRLVGCSAEQLREWLESKFLPGMTWENRGRHGWHIDHIVPLAKFDLSDPEQQAAAFHYTNLQPLWAKDNHRKSNKVPGQHLFGFAYAARIAEGDQPRLSGRARNVTRQHSTDKRR